MYFICHVRTVFVKYLVSFTKLISAINNMKTIKLSQLGPYSRNCQVEVTIASMSNIKEYTKSDGSTGQHQHLIIYDNTAFRKVLLFNGAVNEFSRKLQPQFSYSMTGFTVQKPKSDYSTVCIFPFFCCLL